METDAGVATSCKAWRSDNVMRCFNAPDASQDFLDVDYTTARARMIDHQLRPRGVAGGRLLSAFAAVARHRFAPAGLAPAKVYADAKLRLGPAAGQWLEEPVVAAQILWKLAVEPGMRVLEVGTGSGYTAALLADLGARVTTVECDAALAHAAEARLRDLESRRSGASGGAAERGSVCWAHRCGRRGWPRHAPFDRVWLSGGVEQLNATLRHQIAPDGFAIAPLGRPHRQQLVCARPAGDCWDIEPLGACRFEMLTG